MLPTVHACAPEATPDGALGMGLHAISLLTHRRRVDDIERHRADVDLFVLPPPCPLNVQPIDFGHADELIDVELVEARESLDRCDGVRGPMAESPAEPWQLRMPHSSTLSPGPTHTPR